MHALNLIAAAATRWCEIDDSMNACRMPYKMQSFFLCCCCKFGMGFIDWPRTMWHFGTRSTNSSHSVFFFLYFCSHNMIQNIQSTFNRMVKQSQITDIRSKLIARVMLLSVWMIKCGLDVAVKARIKWPLMSSAWGYATERCLGTTIADTNLFISFNFDDCVWEFTFR